MAFSFRLEDKDGIPADPPTFRTAVPSWQAGDVIPLPYRSLRVVCPGRRRRSGPCPDRGGGPVKSSRRGA
jgi:hypothetical protein